MQFLIDELRRIQKDLKKHSMREIMHSKWKLTTYIIGSLLGAFLFSIVYFFQKNECNVDFHSFNLWIIWIISALAMFFLFYVSDAVRLYLIKVNNRVQNVEKNKKIGYLAFSMIFLVLMIDYLAMYPGWFSYDGPGQAFVFLVEGKLDAHHPVLHTLLLSGCIQLGRIIFNSATIGYGFYTLIQILIVAVALSISFCYLWKWTKCFWIVCFSYIIILFNPIFLNLVVISAHDIIFGAFFLLTIIYFIKLIKSRGSEKFRRSDSLMLLFYMMMSSLFEKQGIYIYLVVFVIAMIGWKELRKRLLSIIIFVAIVVFMITGPVYSTLGICSDSPTEKISVPLLQLTRVVNYAPETLNNDELESYYRFVPEEVAGQYLPAISDTIKDFMDKDYYADHKMEFFELWFQVGIKNPGIYIDAFVALVEGYFYPGAEGISAWGVVAGFSDSLTDKYTIEQHALVPFLQSVIVTPGQSFFGGHVLLSFWVSISFAFWVMFYAGVSMIANKDWESMVVVIFNVIFFGILMLGPVSCIRYVFPMMLCIPMFLSMIWMKTTD